MIRPTVEDYNKLIGILVEGREQLAPDGDPCRCCGDNGHQAFECHHNPAYVMKWKEDLEGYANKLHDAMHQRDPEGEPESLLEQGLHDLLHNLIGMYRK